MHVSQDGQRWILFLHQENDTISAGIFQFSAKHIYLTHLLDHLSLKDSYSNILQICQKHV